ncbi:hypothetical protein [Prevotellamassilia timonensis]|uniref:hypothetical protein n=1 Tax=Prevotellamassilia timonensis TaxID=1852370 RepID=UPI004029CB2E
MADETLVKTEKIIDLSNQEAIIVSRDILSSHTITEIKYLVKYLLNSLNYIRYVAINENNHNYVPDVIKLCATKKQCLKTELLNFASLFFNEDNFHLFLETLPDNVRAIWIAAADKIFLSEKEANELLGEECVIDTHRWHQVGVCNTLGEGIFKITSSERFDYSDNNTYYLTFKSYWLRELTYRCSHHTLKDCQTAVLPDKLTVFNAEADLFQEIPILNNLRESGMLTLGRTHFFTAKLRKALDKARINNFNLNEKSTKYYEETLRSYYLIITYLLTCERTYDHVINSASPLQLIQLCVKYVFDHTSKFCKLFLPHITCIDRDYDYSHRNTNRLMRSFERSLLTLKSSMWVSIEQVLYQTRCFFDHKTYVSILIQEPTSYYNIGFKLHDKNADEPIKYDEIITRVTYQSIKSVLLALASWGIIEIAYDPTTTGNGPSYLTDALRYVRLTNLGKYVLGEAKSYQLPATMVNTCKDFELNADRLLIKVLNPNSKGSFALEKIATPITSQLYRTDFSVFLKECNTKDDIVKNINLFKKYIANEPPQIWAGFFNAMLERTNALKKVKTSYITRSIDAKDKELQDIIMHDPKLKQYILRAEGYVMLIEQVHLSDVNNILKTYGYTI